MKILIVEDPGVEDLILAILKMLEHTMHATFETVTVRDSQEATARLDEVDMAIIDLYGQNRDVAIAAIKKIF